MPCTINNPLHWENLLGSLETRGFIKRDIAEDGKWVTKASVSSLSVSSQVWNPLQHSRPVQREYTVSGHTVHAEGGIRLSDIERIPHWSYKSQKGDYDGCTQNNEIVCIAKRTSFQFMRQE